MKTNKLGLPPTEKKEQKMSHFQLFCLETSLEGWKYLYTQNITWRFVWIFLVWISSVAKGGAMGHLHPQAQIAKH